MCPLSLVTTVIVISVSETTLVAVVSVIVMVPSVSARVPVADVRPVIAPFLPTRATPRMSSVVVIVLVAPSLLAARSSVGGA
jgi:hypothetical protein